MTNELKTLIMNNKKNLEMAFNIFSSESEIYTELQHKYWEEIYNAINGYSNNNYSFKTKDNRVERNKVYEFYTKRSHTKNYGFNFYVKDLKSSLTENESLICRIEKKNDRIYWGIPDWGDTQTNNSIIIRKKILNTCDNKNKKEPSWKFLKPLKLLANNNNDNKDDYNFKSINIEFAKLINDPDLLEKHITKVIDAIADDLQEIIRINKL